MAMASRENSLWSKFSTKLPTPFDEKEWVNKIKTIVEEEVEEEDVKTPVSIFCIPPAWLENKPEAYVPQRFAFGPYHHWQSPPYDMERNKLAAARNTQAQLNGHKFDEIVQQFREQEYRIRCHYHKHLDLNPETLAWVMAIDASFLFEFLKSNCYAQNRAEPLQAAPPSTLSKMMEIEWRNMGFNMILRDIVMLENQIPLFLLRKLAIIIHSKQPYEAEDELSRMLIEFVKKVSPFKRMDHSLLSKENILKHSHLLELLYYTIVPKIKEQPSEIDNEITITEHADAEAEPKEKEFVRDPSLARGAFNWTCNVLCSLNADPIRFIKRVTSSKPFNFIVQFPWIKLCTALPLFSSIKLSKPNSNDKQSADDAENPLLAEEITIPTVTELVRVGVQFKPTSGDLSEIKFDPRTLTMYLPVISLDVNTEVVFRNLVAYEASAVAGPQVFTRYAELMFGIIDTEEDVKILSSKRIVVNQMKRDRGVAKLWNGMSKSVKLSRVEFLDKAIRDVNKYYGSKWRVRCRDFMRKYVYDSWQVLTFLLAGLMLFLTCVQAFCSVYSCNARFTKVTSMSNSS